MPRHTVPRWWLKAATQGTLSLLPGAPRLEGWARRRWTGPSLDPGYFRDKWRHVRSHTRAVTGTGTGRLDGLRVVELGTGWYPIVPLGLSLRGADVVSVDATPHLDRRRVAQVLQIALDLIDRGEVRVPGSQRLDLLRRLAPGAENRPVTDSLEPFGITTRVADARDLSLLPETHGADLMVSNNTLEHIPGEVLRDIFAEFARVGSDGARMSHYVDLADHYAGIDSTIGEFNFLTLSDRQWRLANNRLHYQNRLRIGDYRALLDTSGWELIKARNTRRQRDELDGMRLVPPYDRLPVKELLVVKSHLTARRH